MSSDAGFDRIDLRMASALPHDDPRDLPSADPSEDAVPANEPDPAALQREVQRLREVVAQVRDQGASIRLAVQILAGPLATDLVVRDPEKRARVASTLAILETATKQLCERTAGALTVAAQRAAAPVVSASPVAGGRTTSTPTNVGEILRRLEILVVTRSSLPALVAVEVQAAAMVNASGAELLRALSALAENAIAASAAALPGPGPWTVAVRGRVCETGKDAIIEIADEGPGLPEPLQAWLEAEMSAAPDATRDDAPNDAPTLGRGLPLARGIIESNGGRLRAKVTDAGTVFEVRLPCTDVPG